MQFQAWQPLGRTANFKVRMANQIAENTIALLRLVLTARPSTLIVLENPKGSMLYQLPSVAAFLYELGFIGLLTYLGLYGMDLLKPTWLRTNMQILSHHGFKWFLYRCFWLIHVV